LQAAILTRRVWTRGGVEGLEANALQVLVALAVGGERTVGALVERLALAQGTVSTALARLQERGLVEEALDDADKRRRVQVITQAGELLVQRFLDDAVERADV
jgi:DNA-binding MarR family transcriptional regulator